jgi:hypothetical protein
MSRLETFTTAGLLELYRDALRQLRDRGIIRTANAPAGDYAECIVRRAFPGSELAPNSETSWDIRAANGTRLEVECRVSAGVREDVSLLLRDIVALRVVARNPGEEGHPSASVNCLWPTVPKLLVTRRFYRGESEDVGSRADMQPRDKQLRGHCRR